MFVLGLRCESHVRSELVTQLQVPAAAFGDWGGRPPVAPPENDTVAAPAALAAVGAAAVPVVADAVDAPAVVDAAIAPVGAEADENDAAEAGENDAAEVDANDAAEDEADTADDNDTAILRHESNAFSAPSVAATLFSVCSRSQQRGRCFLAGAWDRSSKVVVKIVSGVTETLGHVRVHWRVGNSFLQTRHCDRVIESLRLQREASRRCSNQSAGGRFVACYILELVFSVLDVLDGSNRASDVRSTVKELVTAGLMPVFDIMKSDAFVADLRERLDFDPAVRRSDARLPPPRETRSLFAQEATLMYKPAAADTVNCVMCA
ncbi:MAG: hypothetical protein MHM6MM_004973 [Cercozoa sp. M6MM]